MRVEFSISLICWVGGKKKKKKKDRGGGLCFCTTNGNSEIAPRGPICVFQLFRITVFGYDWSYEVGQIDAESLCAERERQRFGIVYALCFFDGIFGSSIH